MPGILNFCRVVYPAPPGVATSLHLKFFKTIYPRTRNFQIIIVIYFNCITAWLFPFLTSVYTYRYICILIFLFFLAYEVLSDEKKRQQYDQFGEEGLNGEGFRTGSFNFDDLFKDFEGNGNRQGNGNSFKFSFDGFDDFFKMDEEEDDEFESDDDGDSMFGGFGHFGDLGDLGDSFFGHHRNGDNSHSKHVHRERSSGI